MRNPSKALLFAALLAGEASARAQDPGAATPSPVLSGDQVPPIAGPPKQHPYTLSPARQIAFDDALKRAASENPTPLQAIEEVARAQALVEQVRAPGLPQLAFNGTFVQLDGNRVANGQLYVPATQLNLNVALTLPLIMPQRWAMWAHAKDQVGVARLTAAEAQRQIVISTGRTYLSLLAQHSVIDLDEQALFNDQAHSTYTETRYKGGYGNRIDYVRAAQQVEADKAQLENGLAQLIQYREALGVLLAFEEPIDVSGPVTLGPAPELQQAIDDSQKRPDVVEERLRLTAAQHLVRDDYTDYLPTLSAVGFPFYQAPPTIQVPRTGWEIELVLQWQIYDGGLRYGLAHERDRLRNEADLQLQGTARQAASDVRSAAESLTRAQSAVVDSQAAAKLATSALQLATLAYKAGASTDIEVVDAERVNNDAMLQAVVAEDSARQAMFDLLTASNRYQQ